MQHKNAQEFFEEYIGAPSTSFTSLAPSGSARQNFIGENEGHKFVITYNENLRENKAFFYFSEVFSELNLNTPQVFHINKQQTLYIQEYLGDATLSEIIAKENDPTRIKY